MGVLVKRYQGLLGWYSWATLFLRWFLRWWRLSSFSSGAPRAQLWHGAGQFHYAEEQQWQFLGRQLSCHLMRSLRRSGTTWLELRMRVPTFPKTLEIRCILVCPVCFWHLLQERWRAFSGILTAISASRGEGVTTRYLSNSTVAFESRTSVMPSQNVCAKNHRHVFVWITQFERNHSWVICLNLFLKWKCEIGYLWEKTKERMFGLFFFFFFPPVLPLSEFSDFYFNTL